MSKINWERKVKYVMNDESSPAGQALCEALWGLPNSHESQTWLNILAQVDTSEKSLGDYIRGIQC
tara:strand:+ start:619 stop:813 length:195 start_codon:yes stop_codon:yes gene_type:complete